MILKKKYIQEICLKEIDEKKGNVMKKKLFLILFILFMFSPKNVLATSEKEGWIRESDGYTYYYKDGGSAKHDYSFQVNENKDEAKKLLTMLNEKKGIVKRYGLENIDADDLSNVYVIDNYITYKKENYFKKYYSTEENKSYFYKLEKEIDGYKIYSVV